MNFRDKRVWITGASSGIGRALAQSLADRGANLLLSSRSADGLEEVAGTVRDRGVEAIVAPIDFGQGQHLESQIDALIKESQAIDMLIYAAGISSRATVQAADADIYRAVMEVNYFGLIAAVKGVLPQMTSRQSGAIVAISSIAGKVGSKNRSAYSGSKFAVCGFMDCLRAEVHHQGVRCLTVCPGYVRTNIARNALTEDWQPRGQSTNEIDGGMEAEVCAQRILRAIIAKKDEVVIAGGLGRWAPLLKRICPTTLNRIVAGRQW